MRRSGPTCLVGDGPALRRTSEVAEGDLKHKPAFMFDGDASKPHAPASALKRQSCDSDV